MAYRDINVDDPFGQPILQGIDAVTEAILNLIETVINDRPFNLNIDGSISGKLFDLADTNPKVIINDLKQKLKQFEPRITIQNSSTVIADPDDDSDNSYLVYLYYTIAEYDGTQTTVIPINNLWGG